MKTTSRFADILRPMQDYGIFSRPDKVRGIISIRNLKTGRTYLEKTEDAVRAFRDERFRLDLGMHAEPSLQAEYTALGLELFSIDLETEADEGEDLDELLEKRKEAYRESGTELYR